jgi:glycosyltransferase involved in cell wall biosynthesis
MRILMLVDFYPPIIGGMELHVQNLSTELVARGHDVSVVTLLHNGFKQIETVRGVRVYRIRGTVQRFGKLFSDSHRQFAPPFLDPESVFALRRIIKSELPDVIHAHSWMVHSFIPLKNWSRAKLVLTLHDYSLVCAKKTLMYQNAQCDGPSFQKCLGCSIGHYGFTKGIVTVLAQRSMETSVRSNIDMIIPVSQAVASGNNLVGSKRPFRIIPNFIPDDTRKPQNVSELFIAQLPKVPYLLFVGALSTHKGINVLLQAYANLTAAPPLVLIGSIWPDSPTKFPNNIIVLKNWPHDAVMEAWSRSLLGLVPSIWPEPCPTVVMEAMVSGRPVIASNIGGLTDIIINNETGFLVPPGDPIALKDTLSHLLANPELITMMGKASKERIIKFQASTVVPQIEQVYKMVVQ